MKDIAAFIKCNRDERIRIFIDITVFNEIQKHLKKYKTHNIEFEETISLILENLNIVEKYCRLSSNNFERYFTIVLSRGKSKACILCKENNGIRQKDIILVKLFIGEFEDIRNKMMDYISSKGGFDYDFEK